MQKLYLLLSIYTGLTAGFLSGCNHKTNIASKSSMPSQLNHMICIAPDIYVDLNMTEPQRQQLLSSIKQSRQEISQFFGGMKSTPRIYACSTKQCFSKFGGISAKAKTIDDNKVILSENGLNKVTLSHELAHVEFHKRLGSPQVWNKVPMWFDEGLAVLACNDPKYSTTTAKMPLNKLVREDQWISAVKQNKPAYQVAKKAVENWYRGVGLQGLKALIERLRKGENFKLGNYENDELAMK